jgi:hypothetical protein
LPQEPSRGWARLLEQAEPEERWTALCFLAGQDLELDPVETRSALRRAQLLLAAGGDPRRRLDLYGRAVTAVAQDLDTAAARAGLRAGLVALATQVEDLPLVAEAVGLLLADSDLAWQCFACSLLADEVGSDDAS